MNISFKIPSGPAGAGVAADDWAFYGLRGEAFRLTPDIRFRHVHSGYAHAMATVDKALTQGEGFVVVTGPPGTGKSTLAQELLQRQRAQGGGCAEVSSTQVDADDLLRLAAFAFGLGKPQPNKASLLTALEQHLIAQQRGRGPAILLVDEAQNLDTGALEELRLLSNLTTDGAALVQILLFGQNDLWRKLEQPELERLRQRILGACQMQPLDAAGTREYIAYRLTRVGWRGLPCISGQALQRIHAHSGGIPRRINVFMSHLLQLGAGERLNTLDAAEVEQVFAQLADAHLQPPVAPMADPLGLFQPAAMPELQPLDATAAAAFDEPAAEPPPQATAGSAAGDTSAPRPRLSVPISAAGATAQHLVAAAVRGLRQAGSHTAQRTRATLRGLQRGSARAAGYLKAAATTTGKGVASTTRRLAQAPATWLASARTLRREKPRQSLGAGPSLALATVRRTLHQWWQRTEWDWSIVPGAATTLIAVSMLVVLVYGALGPEPAAEPALAQRTQAQPTDRPRVNSAGAQAQHQSRPTRPDPAVRVAATAPTSAPTPAPLAVRLPSPRPLAMSAAERADLFAAPATTRPGIFLALRDTVVESEPAGLAPSAAASLGESSRAAAPIADAVQAGPVEPDAARERRDLAFLDNLPPTAAGPVPAPQQAATVAVAIVEETAAQDTAAAAADDASDQQPAVPDPSTPASVLLAKADAAMAENRLTLPPGNNAYKYYQAALAEDPDNSHARAGLAEISQRYWQMARHKLDTDNLASADRLVQRGLRVDPSNRRLLGLAAEITQRENAAIAAADTTPPEPPPPPEVLPPPEPTPTGFWSRLKARLTGDLAAREEPAPPSAN